jgi:Tfp pilus assembly protein PilE
MAVIKCPACGNAMEVPTKSSGLPWAIGCLVALVAVPMVVGVIGMLAAIAIPSFVKARSTAQLNACINNMRSIDAAKEQWAMSTEADAGAPIELGPVNEYIKGATTPLCPAQGTYTYDVIGQDPECSVHGTLAAPQLTR